MSEEKQDLLEPLGTTGDEKVTQDDLCRAVVQLADRVKEIGDGRRKTDEVVDGLKAEVVEATKRATEARRTAAHNRTITPTLPVSQFRKAYLAEKPEERAAAVRQLVNTETKNELVEAWRSAYQDTLWLDRYYRAIDPSGRNPSDLNSSYLTQGPQAWRSLQVGQHFMQLDQMVRAAVLDTAEASGGSDIVPTNWAADFIDIFRLRQVIAANHRRWTMSSGTFELPAMTTKAVVDIATETTTMPADLYTVTPSSGGTANVTFSATKFRCVWAASGELIEDAALDLIRWGRTELARAMADGEEKALINGDTAGTHMDTDTAALAATVVEKAYLGYRARAVDDSKTFDGGGNDPVATDINGAAKLLDAYGVNRSRCVAVMSPAIFADLLADTTHVTTVEKYGANAPILTGEVARVFGIPTVVSEHVRDDVDANGVNTDSATDDVLSTINVVAIDRGAFGDRRMVTIESFRDPFHDLNHLIVLSRFDYQWYDAAGGTLYPSALVRNVTP